MEPQSNPIIVIPPPTQKMAPQLSFQFSSLPSGMHQNLGSISPIPSSYESHTTSNKELSQNTSNFQMAQTLHTSSSINQYNQAPQQIQITSTIPSNLQSGLQPNIISNFSPNMVSNMMVPNIPPNFTNILSVNSISHSSNEDHYNTANPQKLLIFPRPSKLVFNKSDTSKKMDEIPLTVYNPNKISKQNVSIPRESLRVNMLVDSAPAASVKGKRKRDSKFDSNLSDFKIHQQNKVELYRDIKDIYHKGPIQKLNNSDQAPSPKNDSQECAALIPLKKRRKLMNCSPLVAALKEKHFEMEKSSQAIQRDEETPTSMSEDSLSLNESSSLPSDWELNLHKVDSNQLSQLPRAPLNETQLEYLQHEIKTLSESLKPTLQEGTKRGTVKKRESLAQKKIQYALEFSMHSYHVNLLLKEINYRLRTRVTYTLQGKVKIREFYYNLKESNPYLQWRKLFSVDLPEVINQDFAVPYRFAALLYTHLFPEQASVLHNQTDARRSIISPEGIVDDHKLAEKAVCCHCLLQLIPGKGRRGSGNLPRHKKKTCRAIGIKKSVGTLKSNLSQESDSESSPYTNSPVPDQFA